MAVEPAAETVVLAERFRYGDESCLDDLRKSVCPHVCAALQHAFRRLGPALIDEAVGDSMWTAWRLRASYDARRGTFAAWFYAIAKNHCLDLLRKRAGRFALTMSPDNLARLPDPRESEADSESVEIGDSAGTPEAPISARCAMVRSALASLPRCQRTILIADAESSSGRVETRELAVDLGISDSAVRQARRRGLKRLKAELEWLGIENLLGASRGERIPNRDPRGAQKNEKRKTKTEKRKTKNEKRKTENGNEHSHWALNAARGWMPSLQMRVVTPCARLRTYVITIVWSGRTDCPPARATGA